MLDCDHAHPMLMTMARAATRMPAIFRMPLCLNSNSLGGLDLEDRVDHCSPTTDSPQQKAETTTPLKSKSTPPEDLQDAWKKSTSRVAAANPSTGNGEEEQVLVNIECF
ncbi:hypothetical protein MMC29_001802 [Sticta canariensis]|nr:hypothetical protein [Sticta canariensis]